MRFRLLILSALLLGCAPDVAAAQSSEPLAAGCTRQRVRREPPVRDRRRPAEVRRDSLAQSIRDTLLAAVLDASRQAGVAEPAGDVLVEIQDRGTGAARAFAGGNVPVELIQDVVNQAAPLLSRWPGPDEWLSLRLDPPPPSPEMPVGTEFVECRPIPLNADAIRAAFDRLVHTDSAFSGSVDLDVTYLVGRDGRVVYARVARGTADPAVREAILALTRAFILRPASVAGKPVSVWVAQSFQFTFGR